MRDGDTGADKEYLGGLSNVMAKMSGNATAAKASAETKDAQADVDDQPSTSSFIQLKGFQMPDSDQIKTGLRGVQIDHGDDESVRYHSRIHALNGEF